MNIEEDDEGEKDVVSEKEDFGSQEALKQKAEGQTPTLYENVCMCVWMLV